MTKSEMLSLIANLSEDNQRMRECLQKIAGVEKTVLPTELTIAEKHAILLGKAIGCACRCLGYEINK